MSEKFALIVANTEYLDPGLARLTAPGQDAEEFSQVLTSPALAGFDQVNKLVNETEPVVRQAIDDLFSSKKTDDLLLFYFSGHGIRDEFGALYLAVKNTNRARLLSTAIESEFIRKSMDQSRSRRQVLILDCCNSGAFMQGTKAEVGGSMGIARAFEGTGYGHVVLTASDATQFAWEGDKVIGQGQAEDSLFTHFLVKGLEGEADLDGDGRITVDDLYDYAYEQIANRTPNQTPGKWCYKQQGEIVLRHNIPMDAARPVALPEDLNTAIQSSLPYVREAAVHQLEELLNGRNVGLARAAREALARIASEDDSRRIARNAADVLERFQQAREGAQAAEAAQREAVMHVSRQESERQAIEQASREKVEQDAAEKAAREKAEQEAAEKARLAAAEKMAREQAEREAAKQAAREKAEQEAAEKARLAATEKMAREQAEREAAEQVSQEQADHAGVEKAQKPAAGEKWLLPAGIVAGIAFALAIGWFALFSKTGALGIGSTWTRPADGMVMVYVPAGTFTMGDTLDHAMAECYKVEVDCQQGWFTNEQPLQSVALDAFWIDKTDVTNAMYEKCVQAGACQAPSVSSSQTHTSYFSNPSFENYPVVYVNWNDASAYCQWAGARLPTEAEWEKAARGTDGRAYPWGNDSPTCSLANFAFCVGDTSAVGSHPAGASPYGALDMAGNVWDWINDWYDANYYESSPTSNPTGPTSGQDRVIRGSSWYDNDGNLRSAGRGGILPTNVGFNIGFRCARLSAPAP
ncbi:MAG: SUMF1/EgtB/PvdO family nonheme iron enzyme [Anaerolineales bacterium]